MEKLKEYHRKRDFARTREPAGEARGEAASGNLYVMHKHAASHDHFDLRLEQDGVLRSWALPKGPSIDVPEKKGSAEYVYVETAADLVGLVQAGALELHPWGSRIDHLEQPDSLVFDLDPDEGIAWKEILRVAGTLRERIESLGLTPFLRTTGGKGLHLVVPLEPSAEWDQAKAFAKGLAEAHAKDDPQRLTTNMSKAKREGRIFIDYLRNARGATAVASYTVRARKNAPVAVPIRWDELNAALRADRYNVANLRRRLSALRQDPWVDFGKAARPLDADLLKRVGV